MFLFSRKALAGIGCTAAAVASTALFAMPAQAASAGLAKVVGSSTVQFNALLGKSNGLVITISGRTVTLNDKVAIKAGKGCKAVKGDKTKVKCKTSKKTTKISVALGDKNDSVSNKTSVYMLADGGSGNDTLTGGAGRDQLQGSAGNDKLYGKAGNDTIFGGSGNDYIGGGVGNDHIEASSGVDKVFGDAGVDTIFGGSGKDRLVGGVGNDQITGDADVDSISGDAGDDVLLGGAGNDQISGAAGKDIIVGEAGNDVLAGDVGDDTLFGLAGNDKILGGVGNDVLIGEDVSDVSGEPIGSNAALDRLDGGANTASGDFCLVMNAGVKVNCERPVAPSAAGASAATGVAESAKAVLQAQSRMATARAGQ
jgi:Ca2+-binding RTX toxin-like protein